MYTQPSNRITIDPAICHGNPCIRGMRWPIEVILDMLTSGMTIEAILQDHPELEKEDILVSLSFAKASLLGYSSCKSNLKLSIGIN